MNIQISTFSTTAKSKWRKTTRKTKQMECLSKRLSPTSRKKDSTNLIRLITAHGSRAFPFSLKKSSMRSDAQSGSKDSSLTVSLPVSAQFSDLFRRCSSSSSCSHLSKRADIWRVSHSFLTGSSENSDFRANRSFRCSSGPAAASPASWQAEL